MEGAVAAMSKGGGGVNAEQERRALGRRAILQHSATFTVTGKKGFFCVPNTDHEVCVNLWERSADTARP